MSNNITVAIMSRLTSKSSDVRPRVSPHWTTVRLIGKKRFI